MFPHPIEKMRRESIDPEVKRQFYFIVALAMAFIGAWINAQGQWVKDFSYNRVVNLPLLFYNFSTSGAAWYSVGFFDDLLGTGMNVIGIIMAKRYSQLNLSILKSRYLFLVFLGAYILLDMFNYGLFLEYYYGSLSIVIYGQAWNSILYFMMLPMLLLCDLSILLSPNRTVEGNASIFQAQGIR